MAYSHSGWNLSNPLFTRRVTVLTDGGVPAIFLVIKGGGDRESTPNQTAQLAEVAKVEFRNESEDV